jgi:ComF family protein
MLCKICAEPFSSEYADICGTCLKNTPPFTKAITYGLYEGVLAEAINQFKFHAVKRLSKPLGTLLIGLFFPQVDCIVPVPLTIKRLRERGFNQSLLIARFVSKETGIPLLMDVLRKKKDTLPQLGLSAKERRLNIKNAFEIVGTIKGLRILLVDDVMTTGATVSECSRQLLKAFAQEVFVLTLARARFQ